MAFEGLQVSRSLRGKRMCKIVDGLGFSEVALTKGGEISRREHINSGIRPVVWGNSKSDNCGNLCGVRACLLSPIVGAVDGGYQFILVKTTQPERQSENRERKRDRERGRESYSDIA